MDHIYQAPSLSPKHPYSVRLRNHSRKVPPTVILNHKFRLRLPLMINSANTSRINRCKTQQIDLKEQIISFRTQQKLSQLPNQINQFLEINSPYTKKTKKLQNNISSIKNSTQIQINPLKRMKVRKIQTKTVGNKGILSRQFLPPLRHKNQNYTSAKKKQNKMIECKNGMITFSPLQQCIKQARSQQ